MFEKENRILYLERQSRSTILSEEYRQEARERILVLREEREQKRKLADTVKDRYSYKNYLKRLK